MTKLIPDKWTFINYRWGKVRWGKVVEVFLKDKICAERGKSTTEVTDDEGVERRKFSARLNLSHGGGMGCNLLFR